MRLAVQAAELHAAREQARLAAQTVAEGWRSETEPRRPIGTQDEIALLKSELDQTKDLGMRFAATAIRLGSEVNGLKSDLKLTQEQILEARRHGDMADAQLQETQCQVIALQAELTRLREELAAQHSSLAQAQQTAHTQAEGWTEEIHNLREELHRLSAQLGEAQRLYQEAQGQMAALQSELAAARAMLAQTQADSAHTEARLGNALATAITDTERARAELTDVSLSAQRQIEALTMQLAEAEAVAHQEAERVAERLASETQRLQTELTQLREALANAQMRSAELDDSRGKTLQRSAELEADQAAAQSRVRDLEQAASRLAEDLACADAERIAAVRLHNESEAAREDAERRAVQLQAALDQAAARAVAEMDEVRAAAQCEHDALQAQLAALQQETQAVLTRSNEQLAQNYAEIATLHDQLGTLRQDAAAQAERLQIALRQAEELPLRDEHEEMHIREDLERALQESARLRDERRAVEVDLERAHAALQEKDRALNDALLLVTLTETAAKASELELLRMHESKREWLAHSNAQRRR